jgi:protein tyrosine/serine phosphatase
VAHVLHRVQPDFLQAALDTVHSLHGGLDAYLRDALRVGAAERKELAARLLD